MTDRIKGNPLFLVLLIFLFPVPAFAEWEALVVDVFDGDTLIVSIGGRAEIVKLFGIDCPEKGQNFGLKAKDFTAGIVSGKTIKVITCAQGRYPLCRVYIGERCLNEELLRAGYAWHHARDSSDEEWAEMQQVAELAEKGLWSEEDPVPPWEFRTNKTRHAISRSHRIKLKRKHKTGTVQYGVRPTRSRTRRRR